MSCYWCRSSIHDHDDCLARPTGATRETDTGGANTMRGTRVGEARALRDSGKALLVEVEGEEFWVPHSAIHADSEIYDAEENGEGELVLERWYAEKEGLG